MFNRLNTLHVPSEISICLSKVGRKTHQASFHLMEAFCDHVNYSEFPLQFSDMTRTINHAAVKGFFWPDKA